jgi:hypothetical protein
LGFVRLPALNKASPHFLSRLLASVAVLSLGKVPDGVITGSQGRFMLSLRYCQKPFQNGHTNAFSQQLVLVVLQQEHQVCHSRV